MFSRYKENLPLQLIMAYNNLVNYTFVSRIEAFILFLYLLLQRLETLRFPAALSRKLGGLPPNRSEISRYIGYLVKGGTHLNLLSPWHDSPSPERCYFFFFKFSLQLLPKVSAKQKAYMIKYSYINHQAMVF